jgi:hypothetical protein
MASCRDPLGWWCLLRSWQLGVAFRDHDVSRTALIRPGFAGLLDVLRVPDSAFAVVVDTNHLSGMATVAKQLRSEIRRTGSTVRSLAGVKPVNLHTAELVKGAARGRQVRPPGRHGPAHRHHSPGPKHEFATLLTELSELLHSHADDQTTGVISTVRFEAEDDPVMSRHALREARTASSHGDEPPGLGVGGRGSPS